MMLTIDALNVSYGETRIINDLSLNCSDDEILAVLGRNGMGKTTLLRAIAGVLESDSGTITFDGEDVTDSPPHERARRGITLIPQGREIFPDLTVDENLQMGTYAATGRTPLDRERVYEYFPILEERLEQKGGTLSGGQQQMLAIGRGLVTNPELILLDEPSEGIQPSIVKQIGEILPEIHRKEDVPVVIVEQNIELVSSVADRGYIIENGRIVEEGDIRRLQDEGLIQKHIGI
ncbi:ABC transporter ATP-binding protein [Haloplanus aerogenes]|nr:ABC transporter ATP-binding protein [Haloplanus aerogenes]